MKNLQRKAIHPVLETMERLSRGDIPFEAEEQTLVDQRRMGGGPVLLDQQDLIRLRVEIRKQLIALRSELSESLTERECYLALFPVVVCIDEMVQTRYANVDQLGWHLLQQEFFKVDQGGELFYTTIDQFLDAPHSPVICEIFYFCLAVGFRGKYATEEEKVASYMRRLAERLSLSEFALIEEPRTSVSGSVKPVLSPVWFYLGAVLIVALFYALLVAVSDEPEEAEQASDTEGATAQLFAPPVCPPCVVQRCASDQRSNSAPEEVRAPSDFETVDITEPDVEGDTEEDLEDREKAESETASSDEGEPPLSPSAAFEPPFETQDEDEGGAEDPTVDAGEGEKLTCQVETDYFPVAGG